MILGNLDNFSGCKYCRKNNAIILGDAVSSDGVCEISKKKSNVRLRAYFSSSKPELCLILHGNDYILV